MFESNALRPSCDHESRGRVPGFTISAILATEQARLVGRKGPGGEGLEKAGIAISWPIVLECALDRDGI